MLSVGVYLKQQNNQIVILIYFEAFKDKMNAWNVYIYIAAKIFNLQRARFIFA